MRIVAGEDRVFDGGLQAWGQIKPFTKGTTGHEE
jgi:hypothetical protein